MGDAAQENRVQVLERRTRIQSAALVLLFMGLVAVGIAGRVHPRGPIQSGLVHADSLTVGRLMVGDLTVANLKGEDRASLRVSVDEEYGWVTLRALNPAGQECLSLGATSIGGFLELSDGADGRDGLRAFAGFGGGTLIILDEIERTCVRIYGEETGGGHSVGQLEAYFDDNPVLGLGVGSDGEGSVWTYNRVGEVDRVFLRR